MSRMNDYLRTIAVHLFAILLSLMASVWWVLSLFWLMKRCKQSKQSIQSTFGFSCSIWKAFLRWRPCRSNTKNQESLLFRQFSPQTRSPWMMLLHFGLFQRKLSSYQCIVLPHACIDSAIICSVFREYRPGNTIGYQPGPAWHRYPRISCKGYLPYGTKFAPCKASTQNNLYMVKSLPRIFPSCPQRIHSLQLSLEMKERKDKKQNTGK